MRCHNRSYHGGQRKHIHVCPFCSRVIPKTYSTFHDWRKHIEITHLTCLVDGDKGSLFVEGYAAGFKLEGWFVLRVSRLRDNYERYQGKDTGVGAPSPPSKIGVPHSKGAMPDRYPMPTRSELADSEMGGTDWEGSG